MVANDSEMSAGSEVLPHAPALYGTASEMNRPPRRRGTGVGRVVATGAFVLLGVVVVLGAASLAALIAGYDPPGFEKEARRVRRFARDHSPDFSRARDVLEPMSREFDRGERWVRNRIRSATR